MKEELQRIIIVRSLVSIIVLFCAFVIGSASSTFASAFGGISDLGLAGLRGGLPDLVAVDLYEDYTPMAHMYMGLSWSAKNVGTAPAEGLIWVRVYFSASETLNRDSDRLVYEFQIDYLAPEQQIRGLAPSLDDTHGYYFLVVDSDNQVAEEDETNNVLRHKVSFPLDAFLRNWKLPKPLLSGGSAELDLTFDLGGSEPGFLNCVVYLSKSPFLEANAVALFDGDFPAKPGSLGVVVPLAVPRVAAGAYNLLISYSPTFDMQGEPLSIGVLIATDLRIERGADGLKVSWPSFAGVNQLEWTSEISAAAKWSPVLQKPEVVDSRFVVTESLVSAQRFYRLKTVP